MSRVRLLNHLELARAGQFRVGEPPTPHISVTSSVLCRMSGTLRTWGGWRTQVHRFEAILSSPDGADDPWDRVLAASRSFVSFPSLGALVPGWLLVVPRRRMINLRAATAPEQLELLAFMSSLASRLRVFPGDLYCFEHGSELIGGPVGCGVDQAHLHIVPLEFDLIDAALSADDAAVSWTEPKVADSFWSTLPAQGEYVSIWRPSDLKGVSGIMSQPRSQWVRRLIAEKVGKGAAWNYKSHPDVQNLLHTVSTLRSDPEKRFRSPQSNHQSHPAGLLR